ncbi:MAG: UvrD-helicase domain-containing protein [Planctomycetaceae bacterium]|jgi:ATP-dependent helicase/nuclease subunit A
MPEYTAEQKQAIEARGISVALSAGAGCGKTFVLTQRFLAQIAPPEFIPGKGRRKIPDSPLAELSSVVAITFTDRAAREMRERVRRTCRERLSTCPNEQVEHWQRLVRDVDAARISTIHSFCMQLLRSNAVESGIDPQSRLFDETTGAAFLWNSLVRTLHDLVVEHDPDALALVLTFQWEGTLQRLANLVPQRYRLEGGEWRQMSAEQLSAHWLKIWNAEVVPRLIQEFVESVAVKSLLELLEVNQSTNAVMAERCETLRSGLPRLAKARDLEAEARRLADAAGVKGGGSKHDWPSEEIYEEVKNSLTTVREGLRKLAEKVAPDAEAALDSARISLAALRVVDRAGAEYDRRKREEGWLDFDDLLTGARNLLRDHPAVRARAAAGISLLMVDEFQDTDRLQAEIVRLLCGDQLTTGRLFLVGDIKQSIYRFRRAEPQVFRELRGALPPAGQLPLTGNFRSQPAVLNFVNMLCDGALGGEYEPLTPQTPQVSTAPAIEFLFVTATADEATTDESDAEEPNARERRRVEADWIARRLRQLLTDNVPRIRERDANGDWHLRTTQPRDIVVLLRAMSDVPLYEDALREWNIDHYVVGGKAFFAQQEIHDIVNLCRVLHEPDDHIALVGVLRSPFFALSDDDLLGAHRAGWLGIPPTLSEVPATDEAMATSLPAPLPDDPDPADPGSEARVREALQMLAMLRQRAARTSVAELLRGAIDETGYDASLLGEFLGERKLANLRKLIDMARDFDQAGLFSLADFARHLQEAVTEEPRESLAATHPESSNVVRVMTIHQSKGLEFPVVVLADMNRKVQGDREMARIDERLGPLVELPKKFGRKIPHLGRQVYAGLEADEALAETQRLLYVATTRAADLLILSGTLLQGPRGLKLEHPWLRLLNERFDLRTGQPRLAPGSAAGSVLAKYSRNLPEIHVHQSRPVVESPSEAAHSRRLSLSQLRESVEQASPAGLPESLRSFVHHLSAHERLSVSRLEQLVEQRLQKLGRNDLNQLVQLARVTVHEGPAATSSLHVPESDSIPLGQLVHKVLELTGTRPLETLERVLVGWTPEPSSQVIAVARECLARWPKSPLAAPLAELPANLREVDFLLPWPVSSTKNDVPRPLIAGQIDALWPTDEGWVVVDYKTSATLRLATVAESSLKKYGLQLGLYCLALEQWQNRLPARLELVYLPSLVRVLVEPTPEFLDKVRELIELVREEPTPDNRSVAPLKRTSK